jgi:hypothetical protein
MQINVGMTQRAAIEAGVNAGVHAVEVDATALTIEERKYIASKQHDGVVWGPAHPTAEALISWAREYVARVHQEEKERKSATAQATERWLAIPAADLVRLNPDGSLTRQVLDAIDLHTGRPFARSGFGLEYGPDKTDARVVAKFAEISALGDALLHAETARREALAEASQRQKAEAEARQQAAIARLREWAENRGSELLCERIAGNYNWRALARSEYVASICAALPGEWIEEPADWDVRERDNPSLNEIRARKLLAPLVVSGEAEPGLVGGELLWVKVPVAEDDDGDTAPETFPALRIDIRCPDGEIVQRVQRLQ